MSMGVARLGALVLGCVGLVLAAPVEVEKRGMDILFLYDRIHLEGSLVGIACLQNPTNWRNVLGTFGF